MKKDDEQGISLSDIIQILLKNILWIGSITAFITILGIIFTTKVIDEKYESSGHLLVIVKTDSQNSSTSVANDVNTSIRMLASVAQTITLDVVLDSVIEELDLSYSTNSLRKKITVSYESSSLASLFISVSVTDTDKVLAKEIANCTMNKTIEKIQENNTLPVTLSIMNPAKDGAYASPNKLLNVIISFILGLILGVVFAFLKEILSNKIKNERDIEAITDLKILAIIPFVEEERK